MTIQHDETNTRFLLLDDSGAQVGRIEYLRSGTGELYATYTGVNPGNEGRGYGMWLLDALAEYARQQHTAIVPQCPFVKRMFQKHPEKYAGVAAIPH